MSETAVKDLWHHIQTLLRLRACEGVVSAEKEGENNYKVWIIQPSPSLKALEVDWYSPNAISLSPAFNTESNAREAIQELGEEAILDMFLFFNAYRTYQEKYPNGKF